MYARSQDLPGLTLADQARLDELIPDDALQGCVVHVVGEYDGGIRMVDVWVDEPSFHTFQTAHLWPAVDRLVAETLATGGPGPAMTPGSSVDFSGPGRSGRDVVGSQQ